MPEQETQNDQSAGMDHAVVKRLVSQLRTEEPPRKEGCVLAVFESPKDWTGYDSRADLYAVISCELADGGLIVYGYSKRRKEWSANWSSRHVVRHFVDAMYSIRRANTIHEISAIVDEKLNGFKYV